MRKDSFGIYYIVKKNTSLIKCHILIVFVLYNSIVYAIDFDRINFSMLQSHWNRWQ